jgi:Domain of unknown function (DUF4365)
MGDGGVDSGYACAGLVPMWERGDASGWCGEAGCGRRYSRAVAGAGTTFIPSPGRFGYHLDVLRQMPKRPRSHQLEDLSRTGLHRLFEGSGWTVEDLSKDYGEDLLVRIFDSGVSTPLSFFVQAKATDNLTLFRSKRANSLHYPISTEHIRHWTRFQEPVILTLWDAQSGDTFWTCIQETQADPSHIPSLRRKTVRIPISCENRMDEKGLRSLRLLALTRYKRLLREARGAKALIELLKSEFDIGVEYSPRDGVLLVDVPGEDLRVGFFGPTAARLSRLSAHMKASPKRVLHEAIGRSYKEIREHERTGKLPVRNPETGEIQVKMMSLRQMQQHFDAEAERSKEEDENELDYDDELR